MTQMIQTNQYETIITLKEITDLLTVEHNKAMKVVEKLSEEPSFGHVEKIATCINIGNGATRDIQTYSLNKKQAIAVGAKLNNSLLMKLIDKLEELDAQKEHKQTQLPSKLELAQMVIESETKVQRLEDTIHTKDEIIKTVAELNIKAGQVSFADFAKNLALENMGRNNVIKFCKARNYIMETLAPYQPYVNRGYFVRKPSKEKINGETRYTTYLTAKGTVWLAKIIKAEYEIEEVA